MKSFLQNFHICLGQHLGNKLVQSRKYKWKNNSFKNLSGLVDKWINNNNTTTNNDDDDDDDDCDENNEATSAG